MPRTHRPRIDRRIIITTDTDAALPLNVAGGPDADVLRHRLRELPTTPEDAARMGLPDLTYCRRYLLGQCSVIVTREGPSRLWHLSIAHPRRYPTWDEIAAARYAAVPDSAWMAMYLPPRDEYVNVHRFCFQLYECPEPGW